MQESWFHSVVSLIFLLCRCMEALQRYNRERCQQRQLGLRFETRSSAVKAADNSHSASKRVEATARVAQRAADCWSVCTEDGEDSVVQTATCPYAVCYQQCRECRVCVHQYTCTCLEGRVSSRVTVCRLQLAACLY